MRLTFDLFDLEEGQGCKYDYFQVYDGNSNEGNLLGKFCGKVKPTGIRSSGNSLYIEFVSDSSTVRPGFLAKWNTEDFNPMTTRSPVEGWLLFTTCFILHDLCTACIVRTQIFVNAALPMCPCPPTLVC